MIPDKAGFWWYEIQHYGLIGKKCIAEVEFFAGKPRMIGHGVEGNHPCTMESIKWLGPVVDPFADVVEFHQVMFPHLIGGKPAIPTDPAVKELRKKLIREEHGEMMSGLDSDDLVEIVDGALDEIYVNLGMLCTYGVNPWPIWQAVHRSNMAKQNGIIDESGKKQKPPGWQPPPVRELLIAQGWTPPDGV